MKKLQKIILFSSAVLLLGFASCKKSYLERLPSDEIPIDEIFETTAGAKAALQGMHRKMYEVPNDGREETFGQKGIDLMVDVLGNDMPFSDQGAGWFIGILNYSEPRSGSGPGGYPWTFYFSMINNANRILFHVDDVLGTDEDKANIKAQALFYRAFSYYNLSLFYQFTYQINPNALALPIYTEPTTEGKARSTMRELYEFINDDLDNAIALFNESPTNRVTRSEIDISVTKGVKARVALTEHKWAVAAQMAKEAREPYVLMSSAELMTGFNNFTSEWIWGSEINDEQAATFKSFISQMDVDAMGYADLGQQKLINRILYLDIDNDDIRKNWWFADQEGVYRRYSQKKFKVRTPGINSLDVSYMRSSEMALIQAEALAHNNEITSAATVLEELMEIRLPGYTAPSTKNELLREILKQRRIELWGEGFRYFDIKRVGAKGSAFPEAVVSANEQGLQRGGVGGRDVLFGSAKTIADPLDVRFLFRIPGSEISSNPLMEQNP